MLGLGRFPIVGPVWYVEMLHFKLLKRGGREDNRAESTDVNVRSSGEEAQRSTKEEIKLPSPR